MDTVLPARRRRGISLTALIDVVFILLMFFMLTSTFSDWQMEPLTSAVAGQQASAEPPAVLLVYPDGELRILTDSLSEPLASVAAADERVANQSLVVSGETNTPVQTLLSVMGELHARQRDYILGQPFDQGAP